MTVREIFQLSWLCPPTVVPCWEPPANESEVRSPCHFNANVLQCYFRPDFVAMNVPLSAEVPSPVDATDAGSMIEMKFDFVEKGKPLQFHNPNSGVVPSTFEDEKSS